MTEKFKPMISIYDLRFTKFLWIWFFSSNVYFIYYMTHRGCPYVWHGGSPNGIFPGSCWCGADSYCMCTPSLAIDAIIEVQDASEPSIVLVRRRDNPSDIYAIPGGFVDIGETVEHAAIREAKEETNLDVIKIEQFRVYSDPKRDKRRHTVSSVMRCAVKSAAMLHRGDDAKSVEVIELKKVLNLDLAFDHELILREYINLYHKSILTNE